MQIKLTKNAFVNKKFFYKDASLDVENKTAIKLMRLNKAVPGGKQYQKRGICLQKTV